MVNSFWFGEKLFLDSWSTTSSLELPNLKQQACFWFKHKKFLTESKVFMYDLRDRVGIHMSV